MIRSLLATSICLALAACGSPATTAPELSVEDRFAAYLQNTQVSEGHGILNVMEGRFAAEVRMRQSPDAPEETTEGVMENRLILGGRFLESRFRSADSDMGPFEGRGLMGFNTFENRYESIWVDSMGTFMQPVLHLQIDAEGRTLSGTSSEYDYFEERQVQRRTEMRILDRRTHEFTMYKTAADGREFVDVAITYTRL
ncbi:MAG: hypothetical protein DHS20C15_11510 [Planctomycetota bacterium]|nr:MAG: hypothetical protein DHS20C15_11510 [Planctomycetota bacterium]